MEVVDVDAREPVSATEPYTDTNQASKKLLWESNGQYEARLKFVKKCVSRREVFGLSDDDINVLSLMYHNVKYLKCTYPKESMDRLIALSDNEPGLLPEAPAKDKTKR
eukprot:GDKH01024719.1.p2 GENE.GDKH01024719.1~~GDKH01024719.1.p2  ORF type:complete len:108 (-),score=9.57 GDKH01024719.1:272-595(-)